MLDDILHMTSFSVIFAAVQHLFIEPSLSVKFWIVFSVLCINLCLAAISVDSPGANWNCVSKIQSIQTDIPFSAMNFINYMIKVEVVVQAIGGTTLETGPCPRNVF